MLWGFCINLSLLLPLVTVPVFAKPPKAKTNSGIRVEYRGLGTSLRLMGNPIRSSTFRTIFAVGESADSMPVRLAFEPTGPGLAQAVPAATWNRGCGLLQVQIPIIDGNLQRLERHPERQEARRLMGGRNFLDLVEAVRFPLEQEWVRLEAVFSRLTLKVISLSNGLANAMRRVDQLDVQACNLKTDSDRVLPLLARWNSTCRGSVPDATFRWCQTEKIRLQPDVTALQNGDAALRGAIQDFEANFSRPLRDENDESQALFADWNARMQEHLRRLKSALEDEAAVCKNRVNIHIQANGSNGHQAYEDNIPSAQNASVSEAERYLGLVSDAFYARNIGTSEVVGLGLATDAARLWIRRVATPPPARHPPFYFAPGPINNPMSAYRFDITIAGQFPCPERPVAMLSH